MDFDLFSMAAFLLLGAAAGFLGGLIGIGGGFVLVPGLYYVFTAHLALASEYALPLSLGTTMASMVVTSMSSARAQAARGAVRFDVVKRFSPWIVLGTALGAYSATIFNTTVVKFGFAAFCLYAAYRMFVSSSEPAIEATETPMAAAKVGLPGTFFGWICGLNGVGGATLFVSFMARRGLCIRQAMATASALQVPISVMGTISYGLLGIGAPIAYAVGFIHGPALGLIASSTVLTAPWGVKLAHALPVLLLKRLFCAVAAAAGLKMAGAFAFLGAVLKVMA